MLMALATGGCMEVFGIEPPPALSNAHSVYDGVTPPPLAAAPIAAAPIAAAPQPAKIQEVRPPVVTVVRVPPGASVLVTCAEAGEPREKDEPAPPAPYKPSPYAGPRAPSLYHTD
jgi:hypothetical protein